MSSGRCVIACARAGEKVLRDDERDHSGCAWRNKIAYPEYLTGTETGAAIKPVIIPQLVDLDPFATVGRL